LEIRELPLEQLIPAPYNPRRKLQPKDRAYQKLRTSLREFGLVEPLVWNEQTSHLVGGHARVQILADLGYETVPVSVVHLSEAQEKALNIVLNNLEAQGRYDPERLHVVLKELQQLPEFALTGFDESILRTLKFEPLPELADLPAEPAGLVELVLVMSEQIFAEVSPALDQLMQQHEIQSHVRRTTS
jgi:ParB-like chromosome segregation protein Spo0J